MKPSYFIHGAWALVTIATFVLGSHWARPAKSGVSSPRDAGVGEEGMVEGAYSERRLRMSTADGGSGLERSGLSGRSWEHRAGRTMPGGSLSWLGPLTNEELASLVQASIKSGTPVERRRAFDRLLEEMEAPSFTVEQAMTIRRAMAENGASGEQWKLFDYAWGANQPGEAVAYLDEVPEQYHDAFLGNMLPGLASESPQMAIDLFAALDRELQGRVRPRLLEGLVDNDVVAATDYIYASTDLENYNWRPMDELSRELVREQGLDSTVEWAAGLPEGPLRNSAWSAAYAVWTSRDPHAALESINKLPQNTDRNLAINGFISALAPQDGERAVQWATEITSAGLRDSAMIRVGRQYYAQDPQAATQWFASSGLPQDAWQQVTSPN